MTEYKPPPSDFELIVTSDVSNVSETYYERENIWIRCVCEGGESKEQVIASFLTHPLVHNIYLVVQYLPHTGYNSHFCGGAPFPPIHLNLQILSSRPDK